MGQTLQVEPCPHSTLLMNGQGWADGGTAMEDSEQVWQD